MAITKAQAMLLNRGEILHYIGPTRDGETIRCRIIRSADGKPKGISSYNFRVNGVCQTWRSARNRYRFRLPIKRGLYEYSALTQDNYRDFHRECDCLAARDMKYELEMQQIGIVSTPEASARSNR